MPTIEREVTVRKTLDQVWDYLTDFTNTEEWDPPTVTTDRVSGDGAVGTVYKNVSQALGREVEIQYTVVRLEPKRLFQLRGKTSSMDMTDTITFEERAGEVTVTYTAEFDPRGVVRLIEPLMPLALKKLGDDAASSMKDALERL